MHDRLSHARGWFLKADSDLSAARLGLSSTGPYDTVCFHAQQATEKLLKGLLALHLQPIPRTHNLEELKRRCIALQSGLRIEDVEVEHLTPYAVELRYDFEFWPERDTAARAVQTAEALREAVLAAVPPRGRP